MTPSLWLDLVRMRTQKPAKRAAYKKTNAESKLAPYTEPTLQSRSCSISDITVCRVSLGKISAGHDAKATSITRLQASNASFLICKLSRIMLRRTTF